MKLKTKLILAFMIVMILPTLFTTVAKTAGSGPQYQRGQSGF